MLHIYRWMFSAGVACSTVVGCAHSDASRAASPKQESAASAPNAQSVTTATETTSVPRGNDELDDGDALKKRPTDGKAAHAAGDGKNSKTIRPGVTGSDRRDDQGNGAPPQTAPTRGPSQTPSPSTAGNNVDPWRAAPEAAKPGIFAQLERETDSGDCSIACRALGSMDRAAGEICVMSSEIPVCERAQTRVRSARKRVRSACGTCPNTTVDDAARIPSQP